MDKKKRNKIAIWSALSTVVSLIVWTFRSWLGKTLETVTVSYFPWNVVFAALAISTFFIFRAVWRRLQRTRPVDTTTTRQPKNSSGQGKEFFMPKGLFVVIVVLAFIAALMAATLLWTAFGEADKTATVEQTEQTIQKTVGEKPTVNSQDIPLSRKVLGVIIVLAVIGIFIYSAKSQWESGKKLYQQKFWRNTMGVVIYTIVSTYLMIAFLLPEVWGFLWGDQIFFWYLTLGIIIFARLRTMTGDNGKPLTAAQKGAWVFGFILVCGLVTQLDKNPYWEKALETIWKPWGSTNPTASVQRGVSPTLGSQVTTNDKNAVLAVIAECESGNRQFDDKDRLIRNPDFPFVVGKWQINTWAHKDLITKKGWKVETEEGNRAAAEFLYDKYGTAPWTASVSCWGPKVAGSGTLTVSLEGPVGGWSEPFYARQGFNFTTGWIGPGKPRHAIEYTTRDGVVIVKEYPSKDGKNEEIKGDIGGFRVRSLEKEPVIVTIVLSKI